MEKILGNYTTQSLPQFPLDCETMQYIQENAAIAELIGNIAGDKIILSGCTVTGSTAAEGYIFLRTQEFPHGEVLHFEGGEITHGIYLEKSGITVNANGDNYATAYTQRSLKAGLGGSGTEQFQWPDFTSLSNKTNRELSSAVTALQAQIASLQPAPVGSIFMWPSDTVPAAYHLCDGSSLSAETYPTLYSVLGHTYGGSGNQFNLPDMQGCFVAGKGSNGYTNLGGKGGSNTVTLTAAQSGLPSHEHGSGSFKAVNTQDNYASGICSIAGTGSARIKSGNDDDWLKTIVVQTGTNAARNASQSHENRPPYIILNYIIKIQ